MFDVAFFSFGYFLFSTSVITKIIKNDLKLIKESAAIETNHFLTLKRITDFIQSHSTLKRSVFHIRRFCGLHLHETLILLQIYRRIFECVSNTTSVFLHMEPDYNMQCNAIDSNANSLVL